MPQLALETFVTQYVWLLIIFFSFYWFSITIVIPRISILMKSRDKISQFKIIQNDKQDGSALRAHSTSLTHDKYEIITDKSYVNAVKHDFASYLKKWLKQEKSRTAKQKQITTKKVVNKKSATNRAQEVDKTVKPRKSATSRTQQKN